MNQLILAIKIDRVGNTDQISPIGERSRQLSHEMQSPLHSMHKTKWNQITKGLEQKPSGTPSNFKINYLKSFAKDKLLRTLS